MSRRSVDEMERSTGSARVSDLRATRLSARGEIYNSITLIGGELAYSGVHRRE